ncbi:MAG: hypothetical protein COA71_12775 [SAR86 cluster bacterium]|uniref:HTH tetR-type domain-containing protein n=1 Tax=SAR86 cluster bacterium TaxID=2030880 RepID=A0A2A5C7H1_9GAMM|nr:TetR family transcriptional regulator [Gammaproteobacteria bacterium AH-315-E17]PCJ39757.1 MAG: hypothetical protein COA71_12775 [SAR86 cluster bacterium]
MNRSQLSKADKLQILHDIDKRASNAMSVIEACKKLSISQPTYYRWRRELTSKNKVVSPVSKTAQKILDTAEAMYGPYGLKVSLRDIAKEAGVSMGTIKYHFNTRNDLLYSITTRGEHQFSAERFGLLDKAESKKSQSALKDIITAYYLPALKAAVSQKKDVSNYHRFLNRLIQNTDAEIQEIVHRCYNNTHKRFIYAFSCALPKLSQEDLSWRYMAFTGVFFSITQNPIRISLITNGKVKIQDPDIAMHKLLPILLSIMKAKG